MNSNYVGPGLQSGTGTDGKCVKVSNRNGYWESSAFSYDVGNLVDGIRYTLSYDVYHENSETDKYNSNRAVILGNTNHTAPLSDNYVSEYIDEHTLYQQENVVDRWYHLATAAQSVNGHSHDGYKDDSFAIWKIGSYDNIFN